MGILGFMKRSDINAGVQRFRETADAVLLDVRTRQEYAAGHIPGGINLPLDRLEDVLELIPDMNRPIFVYCLSGGRSAHALMTLEEMGYHKAEDIGGIGGYRGKLEQ